MDTGMNEYEPDYVSPPGDTLAELMTEQWITAEQMMKSCGIDLLTFYKLILGLHPIDDKIALGIANVTGTPVTFWIKRQMHYEANQIKPDKTFGEVADEVLKSKQNLWENLAKR